MSINKPNRGELDWDGKLNAALDALDAKETPDGAQSKATAALGAATAYTDTKLSQLSIPSSSDIAAAKTAAQTASTSAGNASTAAIASAASAASANASASAAANSAALAASTSDATVADRVSSGALTGAAVTAKITSTTPTLVSGAGATRDAVDARSAQLDSTGKSTAEINAWLAGPSPFGVAQKVKHLVGAHSVTAPLVLGSDTHLMLDGAAITRTLNATGNANGTFVNSDQVAGNTNITISGGAISSSSGANGKHFSFVGVQGLSILFTTVSSCVGDFVALYKNCNGTHTFGVRWDGGATHGEDGLHIYGGDRHTINGCHIISGDDSISMTTENVDNLPLRHVEISNVVLKSRFASEIKIHAKTMLISGVNGVNIGIDHPADNAAPAIRLLDEFSDLSDLGCRDVKLSQVSINMNGATGYAVRAAGVDSLTLNEFDVRNLNNVALYVSGATNATVPICRNFRSVGFRAYDQSRASTFTIQLDHLSDFELRDFLVLAPTSHGVVVGGAAACTDGRVTGGLVTGGAQSGVRLTNGSTYVTVASNRVRGCAVAFSESGAADYNRFVRNDARGNTSATLTLAGANSSYSGNDGITDTSGATVGPAVVVPPAAMLTPPSATAFPAANRAIFQRFTVPVATVLRYVNWQVGTASGNVQVGLVRLAGSGHGSFTKLADTGIIACPTAGNVRTDLGAISLTAGDYAVFLWADNTTFTARVISSANLSPLRLTGELSSLTTGVGSTGSLAWGQVAWNVSVEGDI